MTSNIESIILKRLKPIIENENYRAFPNCFIYPRTIVKNSILFIGINPSSSAEQIALDSYELQQNENNHPYFKRFEDISKYCKTPWTHLDLLYFRETNQNTINTILRQKNGAEYLWEQLQISDLLIRESEPKILIVSNALARTFLGFDKQGENNLWLNYNFTFDYEIGTYRWNDIPVFFSSMLTGQRALDNGSYERLKWQIRRTLIITSKEELTKVQSDKLKTATDEHYEWAAKLRDQEKLILDRIANLEFKPETL